MALIEDERARHTNCGGLIHMKFLSTREDIVVTLRQLPARPSYTSSSS